VAGAVSARTLFAPLGPTYDRYAAALSFGQDPRWRRFLVSRIDAGPTDTVLDVATGTGAVAGELLRQKGCTVVGLDQSPEMLAEARRRLPDDVDLIEGTADELHVLGQPPPGFGQHLRALVEPDDRAAFLPKELARDRARSGSDVEHGVCGGCVDARDEEAAPAWILAERESGGIAVVCRPERREERPGGDGPCHKAEFMLASCR
jgi:SAM-dependent methyltransferase